MSGASLATRPGGILFSSMVIPFVGLLWIILVQLLLLIVGVLYLGLVHVQRLRFVQVLKFQIFLCSFRIIFEHREE